MSEDKLRTAILGLDESGREMLLAAADTGYFDIAAVADKDVALAEKVAATHDCEPYDDYRQLIIQHELDCLLVAAGLYSCDEYVRTAIRKKFNILKLAPAGRDFEEAVDLVQLAEEQGVHYGIATPERFAASFDAFSEYLRREREEPVSLLRAFRSVGEGQYPTWQSDPKLAGGGVLLRRCFGLVDRIVLEFGMPEHVYSLMTNQAADKQQRLYRTEDTAVVSMKFAKGLIGGVTAIRRAKMQSEREYIRVYAGTESATADRTEFTVSDGAAEIIERTECKDNRSDRMRQVCENFALSVLDPDEHALSNSGRDSLKTMAVLEAAYLSARTGFPEEPQKVLDRA